MPAELNITEAFIESLTVEDIESIEDITGMVIDDLFGGVKEVPKGKLMRAIGFVLQRREDPGFTVEAAGRLSLAAISRLVDATGVVVDPLPGSGA